VAAPIWVDKALLLALYEDVVAVSGGAVGLRDEGLLDSALSRPINRLAYEAVEDLCELAATYAVAISGNHPFVDGNKRMAFMALGQFLIDNGLEFTASPDEATEVMLRVARNELAIADLAEWLRRHTSAGRY
jgi:death-on-curing protein